MVVRKPRARTQRRWAGTECTVREACGRRACAVANDAVRGARRRFMLSGLSRWSCTQKARVRGGAYQHDMLGDGYGSPRPHDDRTYCARSSTVITSVCALCVQYAC